MNTEEYWEDVALKREIAVQEGATATAVDILRLYDEALDDIENEVQKIKANFQRRFGIDEETADYFLTKAQEEENLKMLTQALEAAPDEQARKDILTYINRDGLSVRAYSARIERYQAVKESIYARIKMIAVKGIPMLESMMTKAYKESYYGNIEDTAKGLDIGIDFALLNDEAIRQAVNVPWKGSRFSKRLWNNTERLAKVAQDLTVKAMMSGESLTKTANKLADAMQSSKFHATTLIRTEVSHAHNMADLKAYEDMDARKYKYLATLDYRTCTTCQPLDNTSHNLADAKEGVNCPVMHPRCRCTTTIDMEYAKRRARDPVTGKSELVNGDITYNEWVNNMSPEQKQALQTARKKDDNKTADKLQHAKYKKALGTKEVPRGFKEFQEMKYTNPQRYNELKSLYKQANSVDKSAKSGIMKVGSDSVALENQRYGRNKSTLVNKTYIESGDYRRKFDNITDSSEVNRVLYNKSKEMLKHRSGTLLEDMYWIDRETGGVVASALNETEEQGIKALKSRDKMLSQRNNVIAIHTHPHSMPPSASDFNSFYKNNYHSAYIACHNGKVFGYTANESIDERLYSAYIERFIKEGYTEFDAQLKALKKMKENNSIDFWEVE